jgi:hypothetical protein
VDSDFVEKISIPALSAVTCNAKHFNMLNPWVVAKKAQFSPCIEASNDFILFSMTC